MTLNGSKRLKHVEKNLKSENIRSYKLEQQMVMSLVLVPLGGSHFLNVIIYVLSTVRLSRKHKKRHTHRCPKNGNPQIVDQLVQQSTFFSAETALTLIIYI